MAAEVLRTILHYGLHILFPGWIAYKFYPDNRLKAYGQLLVTLFIDMDHFLATPVFDPMRCSIGYHPLHSYLALAIYSLLLFHRRTRIFGIGLCLHLITDFVDCQFI